MNLFPKVSNIFLKILAILLLLELVVVPARELFAINLDTKRRPRSQGPMSRASIPVKVMWQIIRSQGRSTNMGTIAESFSAEGILQPKSSSQWILRLRGMEVSALVLPERVGVDGIVFMERQALLMALGAQPSALEATDSAETLDDLPTTDHPAVPLTLAKSPHRAMETIYRSPDEDLYLVKIALFTYY